MVMNDLSKLKNYISKLQKDYNMSLSIHIDECDEVTRNKLSELIVPLCDSLGLVYAEEKISSGEMNIVDQVQNYLKTYRSRNITSADVCRHIGYSRSSISHQFKNETGTGIREYLTALRLDDAKNLLKNSNLTVTEIAFIVGFRSSHYFTNVFKKEIGITPGMYRKKLENRK